MSEKPRKRVWQYLPAVGQRIDVPELVLVQRDKNLLTGQAGIFVSLKANNALQYVLSETEQEYDTCVESMRRYEKEMPIKEVSLEQEGRDPRPPAVKPEVKIAAVEKENASLKAQIAELEAAMGAKKGRVA
jgi:hypothetical protein